MHLFRAIAFQLQSLDTRQVDVQPECCVFFEAHEPEAAPAVLLRLLALAWGCTAPEVDFYNLHSEAEMLRDGRDEAPGDAALWLSGNFNGPLFHRVDRTLMLVRPTTLARLLRARQDAMPLQALQRKAAQVADMYQQADQRKRQGFLDIVAGALVTPQGC